LKPGDVPAGPILVDTDVFSWLAWQRGAHLTFGPLLVGHLLVISFATVGELRAGAVKAGFQPKRRNELEALIKRYVVAPANDAVTERFAEIYAAFKGRLRGDGINDMWIAATALAQTTALPIATGNRADFELIATKFPDLRIVHPDI
jgi:predicted nucleic acid-binding protein